MAKHSVQCTVHLYSSLD